jgi:XTP/dITP diphosphohydrolase
MTSPLLRAVEVMDQLRSPGGCPWDAAQTHASLTKYLLEEAYEVLEAIETDDIELLREELGDLLLQVLFHSRIAEERTSDAFSIEDVAADLVDKLVRRHPHVFGDAVLDSSIDPAQAQNESWEKLKVAEKGRTSATDGVPMGQPALSLAAKLVSRASRADLPVEPPAVDDFGDRLFAVVREAVAAGVDPEIALRTTARAYAEAIRAAEAGRPG